MMLVHELSSQSIKIASEHPSLLGYSDGVTRAAPLCGNFRANFPDTLTDKPQTSDAVAYSLLSFKAASAATAFSPITTPHGV